jgi:serine/threonine-protein kinase
MPRFLKHGEVLRERYQIRERIGQGGAGSIYLADDIRLEGRLCALKEVEYDRLLPRRPARRPAIVPA